MSRLGWVFLGWIAGVVSQLQQVALWSPVANGGLFLLGMVLLVLACWSVASRRHGTGMPVLVCAAALMAFGSTGWRAGVFQSTALSPALEGRDITLVGRVLAMPQVGEDGVRFRFGVESATLNGWPVRLPPKLLLGWYHGFGARGVQPGSLSSASALNEALADTDTAEQAVISPRQAQPLRAGERWRMTVRLKAPHGNANPHGFDYELWLWEQGIQATGYVRTGAQDAAPVRLSASWRHPVERARQSVREAIFAQVSDRPLAGVIAALVVGDQNAIERADWDVFRATGVAHLMSISGLHITMFAWAAALIAGALWRRSVRLTPRLCLAVPAANAAAWGGLLLATLYAVFSGWGVPAQRTIWMLAAVVLLRQSGRQWPWPQTWLMAMAVVVALDPWALLQAGFWLSFVAVGVLFATGTHTWETDQSVIHHSGGAGQRVREGWSVLRRNLVGAMREQWVVMLALTPLSLLLFNQVSLVGLLANAVAIPWVTLVVTPLAMVGVIWSPVWSMAAGATGWVTVLLQWLASWPLASISVASAPLWAAVAGVAGGAVLAMRWPWHLRLLGLPMLLPVLFWQAPRVAPGQFELLAADVGQGNAVLVRTATHSLLYDTGPRFSRESDAGHRVLVPLLRAVGERLDQVVLSHRDTDHVGGAPAVLAMQPQAGLLSSIEAGHALQALRPAVRCVAGQQWVWDGVRFEVLHPTAADYELPGKSNAMSCVLRISSSDVLAPGSSASPDGTASRAAVALLPGDIEAAQELRLVSAQRGQLRADFLLVPHHGSKTSSSAAFLDAVSPRVAVVQAGYRNRFGHPATPVVARYQERHIPVIESSRCGAAVWRSDQPGAIGCQRQIAHRYWHHPLGLAPNPTSGNFAHGSTPSAAQAAENRPPISPSQ
ncbi:DNA internalization-related competence protein ComEC/Rec2 [Polaromonas sp. YR568]|uniref:DNA internalization-related competence protein ComEC/Rec2 n=1 Tax=Polaromonas sp. YR568 TaxID=1855301 RepID=UPI0031382317